MSNTTPKILGTQAKPAAPASNSPATASVSIYTAPTGAQAQANVYVCNQSNSPDYFYVALVPSGATLAGNSYVAYNTTIIANGIFTLTSIGLNSGDSILVGSGLGNISFTATGMEFTPSS